MEDDCTVVKFAGRFGNQIFQLSAGLKTRKPVLVNPDIYAEYIKNFFCNLKLTDSKNVDITNYKWLNKDYLVSKEELLQYIQFRVAPRFDTVLHIRGKDYKKYKPFNKLLRSTEVLQESINLLGVKNSEVIVITDDKPYAKRVMPSGCKIYRGKDDLSDWYAIGNAYNIILSPGTFSYTAAYLGNPEKVVFPKLWANQFFGTVFNLKFDDWLDAPI